MSTLMSWLACHWFPLLLGALAGWLLNKWLCKCTATPAVIHHTPTPAPVAAPVKMAEPVVAKPMTAAVPVAIVNECRCGCTFA